MRVKLTFANGSCVVYTMEYEGLMLDYWRDLVGRSSLVHNKIVYNPKLIVTMEYEYAEN